MLLHCKSACSRANSTPLRCKPVIAPMQSRCRSSANPQSTETQGESPPLAERRSAGQHSGPCAWVSAYARYNSPAAGVSRKNGMVRRGCTGGAPAYRDARGKWSSAARYRPGWRMGPGGLFPAVYVAYPSLSARATKSIRLPAQRTEGRGSFAYTTIGTPELLCQLYRMMLGCQVLLLVSARQ